MAAVSGIKNVSGQNVKEMNDLGSFSEIVDRYDSIAYESQFPRNVALYEDANAPETDENSASYLQ